MLGILWRKIVLFPDLSTEFTGLTFPDFSDVLGNFRVGPTFYFVLFCIWKATISASISHVCFVQSSFLYRFSCPWTNKVIDWLTDCLKSIASTCLFYHIRLAFVRGCIYIVFHKKQPLWLFLLYLCQIEDNFDKQLSSLYTGKCTFFYWKLLHIR